MLLPRPTIARRAAAPVELLVEVNRQGRFGRRGADSDSGFDRPQRVGRCDKPPVVTSLAMWSHSLGLAKLSPAAPHPLDKCLLMKRDAALTRVLRVVPIGSSIAQVLLIGFGGFLLVLDGRLVLPKQFQPASQRQRRVHLT